MLIPFLVLLGSIIPPIGGVILADYWFARGGRYPLLQNARLPRFNWLGLGAYAAGAVVAYLSPWIAPLVGISVSALVYIALTISYIPPMASTMPTPAAARVSVRRRSLRSRWQAAAETL